MPKTLKTWRNGHLKSDKFGAQAPTRAGARHFTLSLRHARAAFTLVISLVLFIETGLVHLLLAAYVIWAWTLALLSVATMVWLIDD